MDPDTCLANIRKLYEKRYPSEEEMIMLAIEIQKLDEWISKGGFLPRSWHHPDRRRPS